jgi:hypothetical protein
MASRGAACGTTRRANSPTRSARRERNTAACGRSQIRSRPRIQTRETGGAEERVMNQALVRAWPEKRIAPSERGKAGWLKVNHLFFDVHRWSMAGFQSPQESALPGMDQRTEKSRMRLLKLVTAHSKSGDIPVVRFYSRFCWIGSFDELFRLADHATLLHLSWSRSDA